MAVAELVPQVAVLERGRVRARSSDSPATASSSCRCDASGSCQPVIRPSTALERAVGGDDEVRPAGAGARRRSSRARGRPSSRPRSRARFGVVAAARLRPGPRSAPGTAARGARAMRRRSAAVIGATAIPRATRRRDQLGRERAPGARHLGAAGRRRVHVLVGSDSGQRCVTYPYRIGSPWASQVAARAVRGRARASAVRPRRTARPARASRRRGADRASPLRPRAGRAPSALRSSTTRQLASRCGARVEKCTRIGVPSARRLPRSRPGASPTR